jgi:streptomycin 6-kinase
MSHVPVIPRRLAALCRTAADRSEWLARLPETVRELRERWSLALDDPFDHEDARCAWVAPAARPGGQSAVLKIGMPHMEADHEIDGLRFWNGNPTVRVIESDDRLGAVLMERCEPGTLLRVLPEDEQDVILAGLLRRLWRAPAAPHPFRPLAVMLSLWSDETRAEADRWPDPGTVREGLRLFEELSRPALDEVLLATDLHAGNVLRAQREPWLVIDPKPFVGDPAYDATQHLLNCRDRLRANPAETIRRFADLLGLDAERVRAWTFARLAAEPRDDWMDEEMLHLARLVGRAGPRT